MFLKDKKKVILKFSTFSIFPVQAYRELHLIILISSYKRPPSFHSLLFEDGNGGQLMLISDHVKGALFGCLCAPREPV